MDWTGGPSSREWYQPHLLEALRSPDGPCVGNLEKLRADLRRVCAIDNQQFGNILFRRGARTLSQDLDRHFERLPLLVQRRYLQFDPCDRGD
jgi:hypothetical protein